MPMESQSQNRAMHAAEANPKMARKLGIPQSVAREFVKASKHQDIKSLPERVKK